MKCKFCQSEIGQDDVFCPNCGKSVKDAPNPLSRVSKKVVGAVLLLLLVGGTLFYCSSKDNIDGKEAARFVADFYTDYMSNYPIILNYCDELAESELTEDFAKEYLSYIKNSVHVDLLMCGTIYTEGKVCRKGVGYTEYIGKGKVRLDLIDFEDNHEFSWYVTVKEVDSTYKIGRVSLEED